MNTLFDGAPNTFHHKPKLPVNDFRIVAHHHYDDHYGRMQPSSQGTSFYTTNSAARIIKLHTRQCGAWAILV